MSHDGNQWEKRKKAFHRSTILIEVIAASIIQYRSKRITLVFKHSRHDLTAANNFAFNHFLLV